MRVFISYRRSDAEFLAGRLRDRIERDLGAGSVFLDVDSVPVAAQVRGAIESSVERSDIVLLLIGTKWDPERLAEPTDYVRLEIEAAKGFGRPIVPVLINDAAMPARSILPAALADLADINAHRVRRDPDFHADVDRLVASLSSVVALGTRSRLARALGAGLRRLAAVARRRRQRMGLIALLAVALLALIMASNYREESARRQLRTEARRLGPTAMMTHAGRDIALDVHEVTVAQYLLCIRARTCDKPDSSTVRYELDTLKGGLPVQWVSFRDSAKYCEWIGGAVPTLAELLEAAQLSDDPPRSRAVRSNEAPAVVRPPSGGKVFVDVISNMVEWTRTEACVDAPCRDWGGGDEPLFDQHEVVGRAWFVDSPIEEGDVESAKGSSPPGFPAEYSGFRCSDQ